MSIIKDRNAVIKYHHPTWPEGTEVHLARTLLRGDRDRARIQMGKVDKLREAQEKRAAGELAEADVTNDLIISVATAEVLGRYRGRTGKDAWTLDAQFFRPRPVTDADGNPVLDAEGQPVTEENPYLDVDGNKYYEGQIPPFDAALLASLDDDEVTGMWIAIALGKEEPSADADAQFPAAVGGVAPDQPRAGAKRGRRAKSQPA